jgi:putative peptidoglycan lipid II flippase
MQTGTVSWLSYADRLMEFPTALLGVAAGTIILPSLARHHADADAAAYSALLDWGLRVTFLFALPAALAMGILALPVVATLFHHGAFGAADVIATRGAVVAYSVGLLGLIVVKVLAPAFYARQQIALAVRCSIASLVATQLLNVVLIGGFGVAGHVALALSVGLGACVNAALLYALLVRRKWFAAQPGWPAFLARIAAGLIAMGVVVWLLAGQDATWLRVSNLTRVAWLLSLALAGALTYFGVLLLTGMRLRELMRRE